MTDTSVKTYRVVVKATNVGGTVSSATSGSVTTQSAVPVPDLIWFKFDSTTWNGSNIGVGAFVNSASSGSTFSGSYWNGNGTISNANLNGVNCLKVVQNGGNKFLLTTNAITLPTSVSGNGYTLCFWFYLISTSGYSYTRIMSLGDIATQKNDGTGSEANNDAPSIYLSATGVVQVQVAGASGSFYSSQYTQPNGVWVHYAYVAINTSTGSYGTSGSANATFYINNVQKYSNSTIDNAWLSNTTYNLAMGNYNTNMYIADVRLYSTPLTSTNIGTIYNYGVSLRP